MDIQYHKFDLYPTRPDRSSFNLSIKFLSAISLDSLIVAIFNIQCLANFVFILGNTPAVRDVKSMKPR